jgi:hypothetical protein
MFQNFLGDEKISAPFKLPNRYGYIPPLAPPSCTFLIGGGAEKVITFLQHFTNQTKNSVWAFIHYFRPQKGGGGVKSRQNTFI